MFDSNYRSITDRLAQAGIENARAEARYLILGVTLNDPLLSPVVMTEALEKAIERRCKREPLSKILGKREFYGRDFIVNEHVLDPRPDSEILVEGALKLIKGNELIYDLGTGSGCLAVTILAEKVMARALAIDISIEALSVAKDNARRLNVIERIDFQNISFLEFNPHEKADLVISNPPYGTTAEMEELKPEVRDYDPYMAIEAGGDGMRCYNEILENLSHFLKPEGHFLLEVSDTVCQNVYDLALDAGAKNLEVIKDLGGRQRVLKGQI